MFAHHTQLWQLGMYELVSQVQATARNYSFRHKLSVSPKWSHPYSSTPQLTDWPIVCGRYRQSTMREAAPRKSIPVSVSMDSLPTARRWQVTAPVAPVTYHDRPAADMKVTFAITANTNWGDTVMVVGASPQLGNWRPSHGLQRHQLYRLA